MKNLFILLLLLKSVLVFGQYSQLFEDSHSHYDKEKQLLIDSKYQLAKGKGYALFTLDDKQIFNSKEFGFEICHFEVFMDSFIVVTEILPEYAHQAIYSYVPKQKVVLILRSHLSQKYCMNLESNKLLFINTESKMALAERPDSTVYTISLLSCP